MGKEDFLNCMLHHVIRSSWRAFVEKIHEAMASSGRLQQISVDPLQRCAIVALVVATGVGLIGSLMGASAEAAFIDQQHSTAPYLDYGPPRDAGRGFELMADRRVEFLGDFADIGPGVVFSRVFEALPSTNKSIFGIGGEDAPAAYADAYRVGIPNPDERLQCPVTVQQSVEYRALSTFVVLTDSSLLGELVEPGSPDVAVAEIGGYRGYATLISVDEEVGVGIWSVDLAIEESQDPGAECHEGARDGLLPDVEQGTLDQFVEDSLAANDTGNLDGFVVVGGAGCHNNAGFAQINSVGPKKLGSHPVQLTCDDLPAPGILFTPASEFDGTHVSQPKVFGVLTSGAGGTSQVVDLFDFHRTSIGPALGLISDQVTPIQTIDLFGGGLRPTVVDLGPGLSEFSLATPGPEYLVKEVDGEPVTNSYQLRVVLAELAKSHNAVTLTLVQAGNGKTQDVEVPLHD